MSGGASKQEELVRGLVNTDINVYNGNKQHLLGNKLLKLMTASAMFTIQKLGNKFRNSVSERLVYTATYAIQRGYLICGKYWLAI